MLTRLFVGLALVAALIAAPADANSIKLHLKGRGSQGGGANVTLTQRPTQTQLVDLSTALAGCNSTELINATYTGTVAMQLSPSEGFDAGSAGITRPRKKQQLIDYTTADTTAVATGTGVGAWTFTCSGGTYVISWNVAAPEINAWNFGANTLERRGGFPLYYLPGNAADWAITTNPSSGFELWNGRVVLACAGNSTQCPTEASNPPYESTTTAARVISAPTGTYNVGMTNATLGITRTLALTMIPHQTDVAPSSSHLTAAPSVGGQLCDALYLKDGSDAVHAEYGDTVVMEGSKQFVQVYNFSPGAQCDAYAVHTTRAGGPAKPQFAYDPGWIVVSPREPWQAQVSGLRSDVRGMTCAECGTHMDLGVRYSAIDTYTLNGDQLTFRNFGIGGQYWSLTQIDHMKAGAISWGVSAGDGQYKLFITDNYVDPTLICIRDQDGNGIFGFGWDSQITGNFINHACHDGIDHALTNTNPADPQALLAWNTVIAVWYYWDFGAHNDFAQAFYNTVPWLNNGLIGDVSGPRIVGNLFVHGNPNHIIDAGDVSRSGGQLNAGDIGKQDIDGEGMLLADIGGLGEKRVSSKIAGNLIVGDFVNGILRGWAANGDATNHNTLVYPQYTAGNIITLGGTGDPVMRTDGPGAIETWNYNAQSGSSLVFGGGGWPAQNGASIAAFASVTPAQTGNQLGLSSNYTGNFNDPLNGDYSSKNVIIDHWRPKPGSAFETSTAGFYWDLTKVDILARTYDVSILARDPSLIDGPVCTVAGTMTAGWSGTAVVGNTATVTGNGTFSTSGTDSHGWVMISNEGINVVSNSATAYTFNSADIARTGTRTLSHVVIRSATGGKGQCTSNALTF